MRPLTFFSFIRFQMGRFKGKRTKRRYLTNKKPYLWRGQEIQDIVQSPFKSPSKKKPKYISSPYELLVHHPKRQLQCPKIYTPKGKFGFPKKKNIKTGTKSKVLSPYTSTPKISKRSLIMIYHSYAQANTESIGTSNSQAVVPEELLI